MKITPNMVFFITGGASGLGEQTVRLIHSKGAKVAIADWNEDNMNKLKSELKERIATFVCDVTKEEDVKKAIYGTAEAFGTIHVALACAGVAWPLLTYSPKKELDIGTFRKVIDINLYGSIFVAKYAAVVMAKNKEVNERGEKGLILFVSSVAAEEGQRG
jgi:3-hydroxyacyl-CoA dehydrogenase / 3-hydroxy-2-methylbutyryl-CoA dehydrogenase